MELPDIDKRLRYYNGQFLQQQDFTDEQEYHLDRLRRHHRLLHTPGIAEGLTVSATVNTTTATVSAGTAIDRWGRQIVLTEPFDVAFASHANKWVLVVISFHQVEDVDSTVGDAGKTRWLEQPDVDVIPEAGAEPENERIRLARLRIDGNGAIAEHDTSVRMLAGNRMRPEETVERLRLSRQGVSPNLWPVLSSGAPSRADIKGDLNVTSNILVGGTVDGRDVSADGAKLDNLALSQIEGVLNPGGNIDLVGQNGIAITGNNTAKTITFTGGSPIAIDGVENPGGNIDLVGQNGISITPDNTGKLIAFSTSPAAIGALPIGDYLKRSVSYVLLFNSDGNGATRTITCNFQPKFIWVTGAMNATLGGYSHTFTSSGFCRVDSTSSWLHYCHRYFVSRYAGAPYFSVYSYADQDGIAAAYYYDYTQSPAAHNSLTIRVTQVTETGFTVTVDRSNATGREVSLFVDLQFAIFG